MSSAAEQLPDAGAEDVCAEGALGLVAAEGFIGISRAQLYREMDAGRLRYVKLGRRRLIPKREAVRLLAAGLR